MTQLERDITNQLITNFTSEVAGTADWTFFREEPLYHQAVGQNCAVFFQSEQQSIEDATTGWMTWLQTYIVRYWEPAPEGPGLVVDEAAALAVEVIYDDVMLSITNHQGGVGTSGRTWATAGRKFLLQDEKTIRGFEIALTATVSRAY